MSAAITAEVVIERQVAPIVVGADGSAQGREALEWAAVLAEGSGRVVLAVSTFTMPAMANAGAAFAMTLPNILELESDCAKDLAAALEETAKRHPLVKIIAKVLHGDAAQVLVDESAGASLLVVGSKGHSGFVGAVLGSVSQHCAAHAHCPVVVVHPFTSLSA